MADNSAVLVKIIKSFVYRLLICGKVVCCFPLDSIGLIRKPSTFTLTKLGKRKKNTKISPISHFIFDAKAQDHSARKNKPNSRYSSKIDTENESTYTRDREKKVKRQKKTGKKTSKLTSDNTEGTNEDSLKSRQKIQLKANQLKSIFVTKRIISDTDFSKAGITTNNNDNSVYQGKGYVIEMYDKSVHNKSNILLRQPFC
jgi:hypothetical protein